eukprot:scaffold2986_cov406-Prasinococcus_capsulatus_cf.AAC.3
MARLLWRRDGLLGGSAKPRETEQTAELDNRQLLQVQNQLRQQQDAQLDELETVVQSTKHIALAVNDELNLQERLLDDLDGDVDHVQSRLSSATNKVKEVLKKNKQCCSMIIVIVLCVVIVVLLLSVLHVF